MKYSQFKLLVSDLDGTLVPYGSDVVSAKTRVHVMNLTKQHIFFTIATGRSWRQTKMVAAELGITVPLIVQTGALIVDPISEQVLYTQLLHPRIHQDLLKMPGADAMDHVVLSEDGIYYAETVNTHCREWLTQSGEKCMISDRPLDTVAVIKHLYIGTKPEIERVVMEIRQRINPLPNLILWPPDQIFENWVLEVFDPRTSKGQALKWLAGKMGLNAAEVVACGDSSNDLDMLCWAGTGVAVDTSPDNLKEAANRLIAGPEQDGVANFIEEWLQSEEAAG